MHRQLCFAVFLAFVSVVLGDVYQDLENAKLLVEILSKEPAPPRHLNREKEVTYGGDHFTWKSCGNESDLAHVELIVVKPDPIMVPGNVTLGFKSHLKKTVTAPVQLELQIYKHYIKEDVWERMPCLFGYGSCTYEDVCEFMKAVECPAAFKKYGIPCACPFAAGEFNLPLSNIPLPSLPLPSWMLSGHYRTKSILSSQGQQISCLEITTRLNE